MKAILPDLIHVPGGHAALGGEAGHMVEVAAFHLARFPVTNAEYRCFMEAGGYARARYWTPRGWMWRQGLSAEGGPEVEMLEMRRHFLAHPGELERRVAAGRMLPETAAHWQEIVRMPEGEVRARAAREHPPGPRTQPGQWADPIFNAPDQPVSGVTWHEALAYCVWLSEAWARPVRLPTEAEWEWAAGGPEHTRYPWGEVFDAGKANTLEGRALRPTPVGAYPAGAAACGALDMAGNVWEWTATLYRAYPYHAGDGREDPLAEGKRVLRGGSWYNFWGGAQVAERKFDRPVYGAHNFGFRVVL